MPELWFMLEGKLLRLAVDLNTIVWDLKIKLMATLKLSITCDVLKLNLYKVMAFEKWLSENEAVAIKDENLMHPTESLSCYFNADEDESGKVIHVLVVQEEHLSKKQRVDFQWKAEEPFNYSLDDDAMYFVNRDIAVEQLLCIHGTNYNRVKRGGNYFVIPIADNVVGLGKTTFGLHYIKKINEITISDERKEFVKKSKIHSCHTVHIAFSRGKLAKAIQNRSDIGALMKDLLMTTLKPMFAQVPTILELPNDYSCEVFLRKLTEEVGSIFIVLDEIGNAFLKSGLTRDVLTFCEEVLMDWLLLPQVFFLIAGRGKFFSHVGQGATEDDLDTSPVKFERIKLHLLRKEKIMVILTKTAVTRNDSLNTISNHLGLNEKEIDQAASILYAQTYGHPRSILNALLTCKTKGALLSFKQDFILEAIHWPEVYARLQPHKETVLELLEAAEANEAEEEEGKSLKLI
ncbi:Crinkler (CRN) family protein [Thraustotheca clavata]|uniref:Crinkler (CRN) family protein n=1 Tax=Thraustotheca clavata TaxID=74557 RepID=A0A1V9ZD49_9STRA|nr:Crinkler (CRN) family protein [Thraustotheca clavata]